LLKSVTQFNEIFQEFLIEMKKNVEAFALMMSDISMIFAQSSTLSAQSMIIKSQQASRILISISSIMIDIFMTSISSRTSHVQLLILSHSSSSALSDMKE